MKLLDILQVLLCKGIYGQSKGDQREIEKRDPSEAGLSRVNQSDHS